MKLKDANKLKANASKAALLLKTLAHSARLQILCQLVAGEQHVTALHENSALSQSAFSQHLALLRKQQVVKTRKQAQTVFYSLHDKNVELILDTLHKIYCQ